MKLDDESVITARTDDSEQESNPFFDEQGFDVLYTEARAFVTETRRASVSAIQRKFRIGYNRAAHIIEKMEYDGVVSKPGYNGAREVLAPPVEGAA